MNLKLTPILILASILTIQAQTRTAGGAEVLFESARQKETVQGDLKGAIEVYRQIVAKHGKDRAAAARAMLLMAQCHEKLGQVEARKLYEDITRNYADQPSAVSQARTRLAALGGPASAGGVTRARLVWDNAVEYWGAVTADGRYYSFTDRATGGLAVRDFRTGQNRLVITPGDSMGAQSEIEWSALSPDGKRIAFRMRRGGSFELRLVNADGSGERLLRQMKSGESLTTFNWSPDGRRLALGLVSSSPPAARLELLYADTGESTTIPTGLNSRMINLQFSPDGKWLAYSDLAHPQAQQSRNVRLAAADGSAKGAATAAEGARFAGWAPDGKSIVLARDRGGVRNLYLLSVSGGRAVGEAALLHTPPIGEEPLTLTPRGELFYGTFNYQPEAWLVRLEPSTGRWSEPVATFPVAGVGWANNMGNLRFSPDGKQLASLSPNKSISIRGVSTGSERFITPPLRDYRRFEWAPDGNTLLAAALDESGRFGLHRVDLVSGAATFLCDIKPGFVFAPSPDGKSVFQLSRGGLTSIDLATGAERVLATGAFGMLDPSNLRLSHDGRSLLLNNFAYLGVYDIASGAVREIFKRTDPAGDAATSADWSADDRQILVLTRPASQPDGPREFRRYPVAGGAPQGHALDGVFGGLGVSPDGVHAAVVKSGNRSQIWVLENFLPAR